MSVELKAKSVRADALAPTVYEHCAAVRRSAEAIWKTVVSDLQRSTDLSYDELDHLRVLFTVAALFHDIGKANDAFQAMIEGTMNNRVQPVRHEILSAMILADDNLVEKWLKEAIGEEDFWIVVWAVGGHHLELRTRRYGETEDPFLRLGNVPARLVVHLDDQQCKNVFRTAQTFLEAEGRKFEAPPLLKTMSYDTLEDEEDSVCIPIRRLVRRSQSAWKKLMSNEAFSIRLALVKSLLISADVVGSALPVDGSTAVERIAKDLGLRIAPKDLTEIVPAKKLREFQIRVSESKTLATIVTAGCGNGKTSAAYLWAQRWAKNKKLFFCYPTTGTASAGFREYLLNKELKAELMHGRAAVDRMDMFNSPETDAIEQARRLEALRAWGQQAIACTVDTVLGLIQNQRRPLFAFPAIACGAFVFDEIHSYDRRLFGELLRFLKIFPGAPVLLMSATIPPNRLAVLQEVLGGRAGSPIEGEDSLESIKRYRLVRRVDAAACWDDVARAIAKEQKILWACNTVSDAVEVFREARIRFPQLARLLYHSRFRYDHRVQRQNDVVAEFKYSDEDKTKRCTPRAALVVTTQVCEMSLDLDADLMITPECPLTSLIQRLGRLHRFVDKNKRKSRDCLIYPFDGRPYHKEESPAQMEAARKAIDELAEKPCSQTMLAKFVRDMQDKEDWSTPLYSAWLDGGWQSEPLPARDGDNSITLVREEDILELGSRPKSEQVIPLTIPMLVKRFFQPLSRACGYPVAPTGSIIYTEQEGASWA